MRDCPHSREERLRATTTDVKFGSRRTNSFTNQQTGKAHTKGGPDRYNHPTVGQFLTREQTRYIYKKVETGEIVNTNTMEQEIEQER